MEKCKCVRCGHEWYQRKPNKPKRCAGCKYANWDMPATLPKESYRGVPGRPIKYPQLDALKIGDRCLVEWPPLEIHEPGYYYERRKVYPTIMNREKSLNWKFSTTANAYGIMVTRLQ